MPPAPASRQCTSAVAVREAHGPSLQDAERFDAAAFSISRSEAVYMDPQQRLLLERSAEVQAGNTTERTAVFVGIATVDYVGMTTQLPLGLYFATGGANSVAAGRISYLFGLKVRGCLGREAGSCQRRLCGQAAPCKPWSFSAAAPHRRPNHCRAPVSASIPPAPPRWWAPTTLCATCWRETQRRRWPPV